MKLGIFVEKPVAIPKTEFTMNIGIIGSINFGSIGSPSSLKLNVYNSSSSFLNIFFVKSLVYVNIYLGLAVFDGFHLLPN